MQDTTTKPEALSRTWKTHNSDKMDGVVIRTHSHTVTLSRAFAGGPVSAEIDGEAADLAHAVYLLEDAHTVEVLAETLAPLPSPVIGKSRAHTLHRIMGRLGIKDHYWWAAEALNADYPVDSLAALSKEQARRVWNALINAYPEAQEAAA